MNTEKLSTRTRSCSSKINSRLKKPLEERSTNSTVKVCMDCFNLVRTSKLNINEQSNNRDRLVRISCILAVPKRCRLRVTQLTLITRRKNNSKVIIYRNLIIFNISLKIKKLINFCDGD